MVLAYLVVHISGWSRTTQWGTSPQVPRTRFSRHSILAEVSALCAIYSGDLYMVESELQSQAQWWFIYYESEIYESDILTFDESTINISI